MGIGTQKGSAARTNVRGARGSEMKAFVVSEEFEHHATVVFADLHVVARRIGSSYLGVEFGEVSCKREPGLDRYEHGKVPARVLVEDLWWWFECDACLATIHPDESETRFHEQHAYCDVWCWLDGLKLRFARMSEERDNG